MADEYAIGRYRLTERLGTGAFATVWLGYDDELDAPVAIKVLADNWSHDADVRARFVAEARLLRRVRDQRVVRVHDIGTLPDDRPYFVMDYADGGTVAELIADGARLGTEQGLRLGAEIARAVQVLHDHGVAHRDIKPGNLLLTSVVSRGPGGTLGTEQGVVIADLGMAKSLSEASGYTVTVGTPAYMAPEQALGMGFDQRADVYGVAAVTYSLLAGRPPFAGSGILEIAERSRTSSPPPLDLDSTGAIDRVLTAALSFDPEHRPASAGDLAVLLIDLAGGPVGQGSARSGGSADPTVFQSSYPSSIGSPASADPYSPYSVYRDQSANAAPARTVMQDAPPAAPIQPAPADPQPVAIQHSSAAVRAPRQHRSSPAAVVLGAILLAVVVTAATWVLLTLFA